MSRLHEIELAPMSQYSLLKHVEELGLQQLSPEVLSGLQPVSIK